MDTLEFVSRLIGQLLSWPVVTLVVVLLFREQLGELLGRTSTYEGLGQKVTFRDQLAEVKESVDEAVPDAAKAPGVTSSLPEALRKDVEEDPVFAVLRSWRELKDGVKALARQRLGDRAAGRKFTDLLNDLRDDGVVNTEFVRTVRKLRRLRNRVSKAEHRLSGGEAVTYVESARELTRAVEVLGRLTPAG